MFKTVTAGGFFATVRSVTEDEVVVELSPGNEARLAKRAIAAVLPPEDAVEPGVVPEPTEEARR